MTRFNKLNYFNNIIKKTSTIKKNKKIDNN